MSAPEHQAVDGGFTCPDCGTTRETPLGISRHRALCRRTSQDTEGEHGE